MTSFLTNYSNDYQALTANYGLDLAVEVELIWKLTLNLSGSIHSGTYDFRTSSAESNDITAGLHPELRCYMKEKLQGPYVGLGFEYKYLKILNYTEPTPEDLRPTINTTEVNLGLSTGYSFRVKDRIIINPYLYAGFDPVGENEYLLNARTGILVGWN